MANLHKTLKPLMEVARVRSAGRSASSSAITFTQVGSCSSIRGFLWRKLRGRADRRRAGRGWLVGDAARAGPALQCPPALDTDRLGGRALRWPTLRLGGAMPRRLSSPLRLLRHGVRPRGFERILEFRRT